MLRTLDVVICRVVLRLDITVLDEDLSRSGVFLVLTMLLNDVSLCVNECGGVVSIVVAPLLGHKCVATLFPPKSTSYLAQLE